MNKLRIGIDLDGVLVEFDQAYQRLLNEIGGTNIPYYEPQMWHHEEPAGFSRETVEKFWQTHGRDNEFWYGLPPYEDNVQAVNKIMHQADVYFVTKRPKSCKEGAADWLEDYFGNPSRAGYTLLCSDDKGYLAKGLDLHCLIDDKPQNLMQVHDVSPKTERFLIDQSWNRSYSDHIWHRVPTVQAALDILYKKVV